jgi:hypothetical protein
MKFKYILNNLKFRLFGKPTTLIKMTKGFDIVAGFDQELYDKLPQAYKNRMCIILTKNIKNFK